MSKFKVGDRVAVYLFDGRYTGEVYYDGSPDYVHVWMKISGELQKRCVPPQWCRKLKPKKKAREWWVNLYDGSNNGIHRTKELADMLAAPTRLECVRVREVRERK